MGKISDSEFKALISLLDDPDEEILLQVTLRLKELGIPGIDRLEVEWETTQDELVRSRIENIIQEIHFDRLKEELLKWKEEDASDLLLGAILIAKFKYPEIDESTIYTNIERLSQAIWLECNCFFS